MVLAAAMKTPLRIRLRSFLRARDGVAALEFAVILPVMLILYIGVIEISDAYPLSGKVETTASSLADLAAQTSSIGPAEMTNILDAASAIVAPYPTADLGLRLSGVKVNSSGVARIAWSRGRGKLGPRGTNSTVSLPTSLDTPNSFLVMAEVVYEYTPIIGQILPAEIEFDSTFYTRPRISPEITLR